MTTYADAADFALRFPRELTGDEQDRLPTLLEDASFWLGVWVPGLQEAIDVGNEQVETAAKLLVVSMVRRALMAPAMDSGVQDVSLGSGPYTGAVTYRNPEGNLYLYAKELDALKALLRPNPSDAVSMTQPGL